MPITGAPPGSQDSQGMKTRELPSDNHVHSEWSWDALAGSMEATCARAVEIGVRSVAFTEHADFTPWHLTPGLRVPDPWMSLVIDDVLTPPALDLDGYLECIERCRALYPSLTIMAGVELSEPHWHSPAATDLLRRGQFQRSLASIHSAPTGEEGRFSDFRGRYREREPHVVVREYLAETAAMIRAFDDFEVLAHIDYPVRYWPKDAEPYDVHHFRSEYQEVLELLADRDKVLEVNTRVPLHAEVLTWWREAGGVAITFASDAHDPHSLAAGFGEARDMAEAAGFRPSLDPMGVWGRA